MFGISTTKYRDEKQNYPRALNDTRCLLGGLVILIPAIRRSPDKCRKADPADRCSSGRRATITLWDLAQSIGTSSILAGRSTHRRCSGDQVRGVLPVASWIRWWTNPNIRCTDASYVVYLTIANHFGNVAIVCSTGVKY